MVPRASERAEDEDDLLQKVFRIERVKVEVTIIVA
jgi:hypothetical protein